MSDTQALADNLAAHAGDQDGPSARLSTTGRTGTILWMLVLPVPIVILLGVIATWLIVPSVVADNVRDQAVESAKQTAGQFKAIRGYYTRNVISKVVKSKVLKPTFSHKTQANGVPLPATFVHDMSALLEKEDTSVKLYSKFPFPNRNSRQLDGFQSAAWDFLVKNPDADFVQQQTVGGREIVRVAIADKMVAQGCVNCHNTRADSPKTDWKLNEVRGVLEVATFIDAPLSRGFTLSTSLVIATLIMAVLLTAVAFYAAIRVSNPLRQMSGAMGRLAGGDMDIDIPGDTRNDEIGGMADSVKVFRENAAAREDLEQRQESEREAQMQRSRTLDEMNSRFEIESSGVLESVSASADQLKSTAEQLSATANSTNEQATSVASAAQQASNNVQTVASAAEELSSSISEISRQVNQSTTIASTAMERAEMTNEQIQGLATSASKIGEVVELITDIAEQTNLLALNATIEAARAGEAGKGFAVVASEVKNLANQTAKATEEISSQIGSVQEATKNSVEAIGGITDIIREVNEIASSVAAAVEEQGAATQEIARNVEQASSGTQLVSSNIESVTRGAGETGSAANQLLDAADGLSGQAGALRQQVQKFLDDVKNV